MDRGRKKGLFWNDTFRKCVSAIVTIAMVTQNLTFGGRIVPGIAAEVPQEATVAEAMSGGEDADAASEEAKAKETGDAEGEVTAKEQLAEQQQAEQLNEQQSEQQPAEERETAERSVAAILSLAIRNLTTESEIASAAENNTLSIDLGYEGLEAGAEYEAVIELLDAVSGDVLCGQSQAGEQHNNPLEYRKKVSAGEAAGTLTLELADVDLHWVAGRAVALRVTLRQGDAQVVQRTFDAREDAHIYVPSVESALHAADGTQELAAEEGAVAVDSLTVRGLPKGIEAQVTGALATAEGEPVAAEVATVAAGADGVATAELAYPAFDARAYAGKQLASNLSLNVNGRNVAAYPVPEGRRREGEADRRTVAIAAVAEQAETTDGEQGDGEQGEEPDGEDADDSDSDSPHSAPADGEGKAAPTGEGHAAPADGDGQREGHSAPADGEGQAAPADEPQAAEEPSSPDADSQKTQTPLPFDGDTLSPVITEQAAEGDGASVSRADTGIVAVVLEGEATKSKADAARALAKEVGRGEALQLAAALNEEAPEGDAPTGASNSAALDLMSDGARARDNLDGNNIEDLVVKWITPDDFADGDDTLLSTRPGGSDRSDARQSIIAQIDYSVSGEHDYGEGDIRIMVPATMFRLRNGRQAGKVVIPLAAAPSRSTDFNWQLISDEGGDYYVFTNTRAMSAATKGFIQVEWNNLTPHEIADAYQSRYTNHNAGRYNDEGAVGVTGQNQTAPWYAYMEVTTFRDNTLRAKSNQINALMDTSEVVDAAYKRHTTSSPTAVSKGELPAGRIPAAYADEEYFVIVDWYTYAHYRGNQPFTLDIKDELDLAADRQSGATMDGFVYDISVNGESVEYTNNGATVNVTGIYSGWPSQEEGETAYVHVYSAYPASQFDPEPAQYVFHNKVTYKLRPIDEVDDYTEAIATDNVSYSWHPSEWRDTTGHFMVFKWGNDGEGELENYAERDMVAHRPRYETETISRMGDKQHYSTWYGIYDDAINKLRDGKDVRLWYTIKSEGWVLPWTLQRPTSDIDPNAVNEWWQWAKWDDKTQQYMLAETVDSGWAEHAKYDAEKNIYTTDKSATDGYELIPYTRIESNYLKRPVTMVTTDQGLHLEGTTSTDPVTYNQSVSGGQDLTPGSDYTFDYVEVQKPRIGKLVGINIKADGSYNVKNNQDGTFEYAEDDVDGKIPPIIFQVEVDGQWQQSGNDGEQYFAKVEWSSGSPVITYADGHTENSAVVKMPENTTNFRTVATTTQNAYLMEYLYPGVTLTPQGQANLKKFCKDKFTNAEGGTVYRPSTWVYNGVHMDAYRYDNAGTVMDEANPLFQRTKWGEDRLNGYTEDLKVTPKKSAEFDHAEDVDYERRLATIHYTAEVHESSFITDRATYDAALEDEGIPQLRPETSGIWYDLLPEGMTPNVNSVRLRDGDSIRRAYTKQNWRGTGRTMLIVEADLTPDPQQYKETPTSVAQFWEDVPTITFDAVMDLDTWVDLGGNAADAQTGITSHNVVAFESSRDMLGNVKDYSGEYDEPDPGDGCHNIVTKSACKTSAEVSALTGLDPKRTTPSFVYAGVDTRLAFPTAARTSLSKNIMVNDDGRWSQGTACA